MKKFSKKDLLQIKNHGLSLKKVQQNLSTFEEGIPFVKIVAPATLENGIQKLSEKSLIFFSEKYEKQKHFVVKFVPASGAATRMFKLLHQFLLEFDPDTANLQEFIQQPAFNPLKDFFEKLPNFAFYELALTETKKHCPNFEHFPEEEKKYRLVKTILDDDKLNFSNLPKGLVPFHSYPSGFRTAYEEHFFEAIAYSSKNNTGNLHFTVAEKHLKKFEYFLKKIEEKNMSKFDVSFSFQQKNTDIIAVDMKNEPVRDESGNLVFRPSGHGALLENLNQIDADIIFIKNIDNVSIETNLSLVSSYKKALAGILLELQEESFRLSRELQDFDNLAGKSKKDLAAFSEEVIQQAKVFLKEKLNVPHEPGTLMELKNLLNRPIRVCGMVKNTGAPGGGPFWVSEKNRGISLQIVEMAQIDIENPQQKKILDSATYFNPVDLVCGVKNYQGEKFNLMNFSDPKKGFITKKSMNGRDLKALELPGLWNGTMEFWNTVFVEVPLETFNPVKTVMDLLKPEHQ